MKKYYFDVSDYGDCREDCNVMKGLKIGSYACKKCKFNCSKEKPNEEPFVECVRINEAIGKVPLKEDIIISKKQFDDYKLRLIIEIENNDGVFRTDLYTNSDDMVEIETKLISVINTEKINSFKVVNYFTKKHDENVSEILNEFLKD